MKNTVKSTLAFLLLVVMFTLVSTSVSANSQQAISVVVDGYEVEFDVEPTIINGRTMVPLRAIFEAFGATVEWNQSTKTVTSNKTETTVNLTVGSKTMYVNGSEEILDEPATIIDSRTLVPVRAISEAFNCQVDWDGSTKTVLITTSGDENQKYNNALEYIENGNYDEAYRLFEELGTYKDSAKKLTHFRYVCEKVYLSVNSDDNICCIENCFNKDNLPIQQVFTTKNGTKYIEEYVYDEIGRIIKKQSGGGRYVDEYTYDVNGNLVKEVNVAPAGRTVTECMYDDYGRKIQQVCTDYHLIDNDEDVNVIYYTYDIKGNLIKETTDYGWYEYTYDADGNLVKKVDLDGYDLYTYDSNGNLVKRYSYTDNPGTIRERVVVFEYDENANLIKVTFDDVVLVVKFTYDSDGNVIKAEALNRGTPIEVWEYTYKFVYIPYDLSQEIEELLYPEISL